MEFPETYFQILFNIVRKQNMILLHEIAIRERVPEDFMTTWTPSRAAFRNFMRTQLHYQDQTRDHKVVASPSNEHSQAST